MGIHRQTIEFHDEDVESLKDFIGDVDTVAQLVIECFETNPSSLLSPIIREMIVKHAQELLSEKNKLGIHLRLDNASPKPIKIK